MRSDAILMVVAVSGLALACGSTVIIPGELGDSTGVGAGLPTGGFGANGAGNGSGAGKGSGAGNGSGAGSGSGGSKTEWANAFGTEGAQHLRGLASDAAGNLFLTGDYGGALDFGDGKLPEPSSRSSYVTKLDSKGKTLWSVELTAEDCASTAVAVDLSGNVFVTGFAQGALAVDGDEIQGKGSIFVIKLDAAGSLVWGRAYGSGAGMELGESIAADPSSGDVIVGGARQGAVDFGGGPIGKGSGFFVVKLDAEGNHVFSTGGAGLGAFVSVDAKGRAVVATNTTDDAMGLFVLGDSGAAVWEHTYGPGSFRSVAVGPNGDVLVTGITTSADFGGGPIKDPLPAGAGFLVALDAQGKHRFTRGLSFGDHQSVGVAVAVDAQGNADVTGSYQHEMTSSQVIQSAFLVQFDAAGNKGSSRTFGPLEGGGSLSQQGWGIAPAKDSGIYVGGDFYSAIHVAGEKLDGEGSADIFVARLVK